MGCENRFLAVHTARSDYIVQRDHILELRLIANHADLRRPTVRGSLF